MRLIVALVCCTLSCTSEGYSTSLCTIATITWLTYFSTVKRTDNSVSCTVIHSVFIPYPDVQTNKQLVRKLTDCHSHHVLKEFFSDLGRTAMFCTRTLQHNCECHHMNQSFDRLSIDIKMNGNDTVFTRTNIHKVIKIRLLSFQVLFANFEKRLFTSSCLSAHLSVRPH